MSHVNSSTDVCHELDCLRLAVGANPLLEWCEGQRTWTWWGTWANDYHEVDAAYKQGIPVEDYGESEHAIKVKGTAYEIGVVKRRDGNGHSLVFDFYGSSGRRIVDVVGKTCEKLLTEYHRQVAMKHANEKGWTYHEEGINEDGELVVELIPNQY